MNFNSQRRGTKRLNSLKEQITFLDKMKCIKEEGEEIKSNN